MQGKSLLEQTVKETYEFITLVKKFTNAIAEEIIERGINKGASKLDLNTYEEIFSKIGPELEVTQYGTDEYHQIFNKMCTVFNGLKHGKVQKRANRSNKAIIYCKKCGNPITMDDDDKECPECKSSIFEVKFLLDDINIVDLVELLCNWKAATIKHDGDFERSIEMNQERFAYSNDYKRLFINSLDYFYKYNFGYSSAVNCRTENFYADTIEAMFEKIDNSKILTAGEKNMIKYGVDNEFNTGEYYSTSYTVGNVFTIWWNVNKYINFLNKDENQ